MLNLLCEILERSTSRNGTTQNDNFGYNSRSEITTATLGNDNYAYAFDHIGNRATEAVAGTENAYATNSLNQYTEICSAEPNQQTAEPSNQPSSLQLSYDADGNATLVQTSTGTWNVEYNAENRPVRWTNAETGTVITMTFDSQGRRTEYKSVTNGTQNTWLRFLYDGYLCVQVLYSNEPYNVFKEFVWDPTEPVATRPLVFRYAPNSLNLFYAFDGNKNVSDVFYRMTSNGIGAHYDYAPFGGTTRTHRDSSAAFDIVALNPFRFSSEYYDSELDLVYYNYRHYSPSLGRFLSRDPIEEQGGLNLYAFVGNNSISISDILGNMCCVIIVHPGENSFAGHAILDCGDEGYLSFFPNRTDGGRRKGPGTWTRKERSREDDLKEYGDWTKQLKNGVNDDYVEGKDGKKSRITRQCLPTCIDSSKAKAVIDSLIASTPNWDFDDSNCADMVLKALSQLIKSDKPKCKKRQCPRDLLRNNAWITTPTGVKRIVDKIQANNCNRYECVDSLMYRRSF